MRPIRGGLLSGVGSIALAGLLLLLVTATALAVTGNLSQPAGTGGCIAEGVAATCTDGHALRRPLGVTVSPDGKSVYVASFFSQHLDHT